MDLKSAVGLLTPSQLRHILSYAIREGNMSDDQNTIPIVFNVDNIEKFANIVQSAICKCFSD